VRLGGLRAVGFFRANLVVLGQVLADVTVLGGLAGRIAAEGGIAGNLVIKGGLATGSLVVSGARIGDTALGTRLNVTGSNRGVLAATGAMVFVKSSPRGAVFNNATGVNADAIIAIFTDDGLPLALDLDPLDLLGLDLILADLTALFVDGDGKLAGPKS
jgi:hypothetical protein